MRAISAIQADLAAAYAARSDLISGRVSSIAVPGHQTQFLSRADIEAFIASLNRELAQAEACAEGATDGRSSGFIVNRLVRG